MIKLLPVLPCSIYTVGSDFVVVCMILVCVPECVCGERFGANLGKILGCGGDIEDGFLSSANPA